MKAAIATASGSPDVIRITEVSAPVPNDMGNSRFGAVEAHVVTTSSGSVLTPPHNTELTDQDLCTRNPYTYLVMPYRTFGE